MDLICSALRDEINGNDTQDLLLVAIEGYDVTAPEKPDWKILEKAMDQFAQDIMKP